MSIKSILVLPLHGTKSEWDTVDEAIVFIERYDVDDGSKPVVRYEIEIRYNTDESVNAKFADKEMAIKFLRSYQRPNIRPKNT